MPSAARNLQVITRVIATIAIVAGLLVFVGGWLIGWHRLAQPLEGTASTKVNTSLAIITVGVILWLLTTRHARWLAALLSVAVLLLGLVTLAEYAELIPGPGIDQLIVIDPGDAGTPVPGRMGVNSAMCFVLIGSALLLQSTGIWASFAQALAAVSALLGYTAVMGFALNNTIVQSGGNADWTQMALSTALLISLISFASIVVSSQSGWARIAADPLQGGRVVRIVVPLFLLVALVLAFISRIAVGRDTGPVPTQVEIALAIVAAVLVIVFVAIQSSRIDRARIDAQALSDVMDAAPDGMVMVDSAGKISVVNQAFAKMVELPGHELIGTPVTNIVARSAAVTDQPLDWWNSFDPSRDETSFPAQVCAELSGTRIPVQVKVAVAPNQEAGAAILSLRDQTDQLRLTGELESFAYVASHDLQAPLRTVIGFSELLKESFEAEQLTAEQLDYLREIESGAGQMRTLIQSVLAYSRLSRGTIDTHTRIEIADLIGDSVTAVQQELEAAEGEISLQLAPRLATVGRRELLQAAFEHVLRNSIAYASPQRPLRIEIASRQTAAGQVEIEIKDNGMGVDPEQAGRAFELFQRLTTQGEGLGIGLAVTRKIVQRHSGRIKLVSDGSTGTTVAITLPQAPEDR